MSADGNRRRPENGYFVGERIAARQRDDATALEGPVGGSSNVENFAGIATPQSSLRQRTKSQVGGCLNGK